MDADSQPEKYKRIFAQRLAEECQARGWPESQWQKKLKEITGTAQATVSRWLNGESIPQPLARQALSKEFHKLDSYWLGGKADIEIQTDKLEKAEGKAMELQETYGELKPGLAGGAPPGRMDYSVFASSELKRMLKHLAQQLDTSASAAHAPSILNQIELITVTLRAKLREAHAP